MLHFRYSVKDVNSHSRFRLWHVSCPYSAPQGWSIISLNLLEPVLILLEARRLSVSFSLASFKGSLSFLFPFHCLLPVHQAGQLQPVIWSQCVSERGHTRTAAASSSAQRKWETLSTRMRRCHSCRSQRQGQQQEQQQGRSLSFSIHRD